MISRLISLVILVPLAILLVVFCVSNRQLVPVSLDPLGTMPQLAFEAPLFVLLFAVLILGTVLGGIGTWFTQAHYRRLSWKRKYEVERLRRESEEAKARLRQAEEHHRAAAAQQPSGPALAAPARGVPALTHG